MPRGSDRRRRQLIVAAAYVVNVVGIASTLYASHVFLALVHELRAVCSLRDSHYVGLNEQVAIFLYMCVTSLSIWHVGKRFQHSNETIGWGIAGRAAATCKGVSGLKKKTQGRFFFPVDFG